MAKKENLVEAAITGALEKYCNEDARPQLVQFRPYSRQQGADMRLYCGDIVGIVDQSRVLLLEIKERDCDSGVLTEFNQVQFSENLDYERLGVPIAYAYNEKPVGELRYFAKHKTGNWAEEALRQIKRSPPSALPSELPKIDIHESLLEWLVRQDSGDGLVSFGKIHGAIQGPEDLRNGMLVLIYSATKHQLTTLTPKQLDQVIACLQNNPTLTPAQQKKLKRILDKSATVFDPFAQKRVPPGPPTTQHAPDDENDNDSDVGGGPRLRT